MICGTCNTVIRENAKFCNNCGVAVQVTTLQHNCQVSAPMSPIDQHNAQSLPLHTNNRRLFSSKMGSSVATVLKRILAVWTNMAMHFIYFNIIMVIASVLFFVFQLWALSVVYTYRPEINFLALYLFEDIVFSALGGMLLRYDGINIWRAAIEAVIGLLYMAVLIAKAIYLFKIKIECYDDFMVCLIKRRKPISILGHEISILGNKIIDFRLDKVTIPYKDIINIDYFEKTGIIFNTSTFSHICYAKNAKDRDVIRSIVIQSQRGGK